MLFAMLVAGQAGSPSYFFQKSACEIFHDEASFQFSNPQLVWLIEQSVSSEAIFFTVFIVKPFSKIFLVCAFFAAMFTASLGAQPSSQTATSNSTEGTISNPAAVSVPAKTEAAPEAIPQAAPVLFWIGPLPVTNSMVCTWIVALLILVIVRFSTWKIKEVPTGMQNVMEALVEGWENLMGNILDARVTKWVFPFATTFFIFIVISNLVDLLPGVGSIGFGTPDKNSSLPFAIEHVSRPFFRPPTTDANLTVAMSGIFFVMSLYWAIRYNGFFGLIKHVFGVKVKTNKWVFPFLLLLFIFVGLMETLSILFVRPVALAMRLYGNIFGGENVLDMMLNHKSLLLSIVTAIPFYFYELLVCVLQAFVFAMLTIAFVGTLCTHDEETEH
jgi:F-type H+-transporting ATPase subunit a